ncbi:MAG TPA: redoxin domain-containing protein [Thermoanaerobaculia bacterium]
MRKATLLCLAVLLFPLALQAITYDYESELRTPPGSDARSRALYILALTRGGSTKQAQAMREALIAEHPDDPWTRYLQLTAKANRTTEETAALLALAGDNPPDDFARIHALTLVRKGPAEAYAYLDTRPATPTIRAARVKLRLLEAAKDTAAMKKIAEEVLQQDSDNLEALVETVSHLQMQRLGEAAYPLARKAVELTPALFVHRFYWQTVRANSALSDEQKNQEIAADVASLLAQRDWPEVWQSAAQQYAEMHRTEEAAKLRERVLREAPDTIAAQLVMRDKLNEDKTLESALAAMRYPHPIEPQLVHEAAQRVFGFSFKEPKLPDDVLLEAVRAMQPGGARDVRNAHVLGPLQMMRRKLDLAEAERFARAGFASAKENAERFREFDPKRAEEFLTEQNAMLHDTLGQLLLAQKRNDEALKELLAARAIDDESADILLHLGQAYEATGALDKAETAYQQGMQLDALKTLYERRHKTLAGWESYLATTKDKNAAGRKKKALASRAKKPRNAPAFALKTLDGKNVTLKDLRGKAVVINFWGVWCGWCVREMPDFQQLVQKYAKDKKVAVVTINNDPEADTPRKWMASKKYAFPVLLDDGFVDQNVNVFPTTWFIDKQGRIAFEILGSTEKLVEEFSWRIDALR